MIFYSTEGCTWKGDSSRGTRSCREQAAQHQLPVQRINRIPGCTNMGAVCKASILLLKDISNKMNNKIE